MSDAGLEIYGLGSAAVLIGGGLYGIFRSRRVAAGNRAHVESGEERYFEERRARDHYPSARPRTDPGRIRRAGWIAFAVGAALILLYSPVSIFHWS